MFWITLAFPFYHTLLRRTIGASDKVLTEIMYFVTILIENHFHLPTEMRYTERKIESILRRSGFKITPQRRTILSAIAQSREHLTPAAIHDRVCQEHPGIGLVTVYRTLEMLAKLGLICEMNVGGNCRSYLMRRASEHHHHLICSDCGTVIDFTDCDLSELERRISRETSFKINGHLLEFVGQCRDCLKRTGV
jgi:Fur family ferric uptake transcriptional regulator